MLLEGYLNEEFVLTHVTNVIALLRECNIALRWYMLHSAALPPCEIVLIILLVNFIALSFYVAAESNKRCKNAHELMLQESKFNTKDMFQLLLNTSQLELKIKEFFKTVCSRIFVWELLLKYTFLAFKREKSEVASKQARVSGKTSRIVWAIFGHQSITKSCEKWYILI